MGKSRTHIQIRMETYKEAKKIVDEMERIGLSITMEEAVYKAKSRNKNRTKKDDAGWYI